ncbi:hypothetical protein D3C80_2068350 [compost metagenome]
MIAGLTFATTIFLTGSLIFALSDETPTAMYGAMTNETIDINLIRMFIEGPEVSLNGSPTVSPVTEALCGSDFL